MSIRNAIKKTNSVKFITSDEDLKKWTFFLLCLKNVCNSIRLYQICSNKETAKCIGTNLKKLVVCGKERYQLWYYPSESYESIENVK